MYLSRRNGDKEKGLRNVQETDSRPPFDDQVNPDYEEHICDDFQISKLVDWEVGVTTYWKVRFGAKGHMLSFRYVEIKMSRDTQVV